MGQAGAGSEEEDEEPDFSFLSGRLVAKRSAKTLQEAERAPSGSSAAGNATEASAAGAASHGATSALVSHSSTDGGVLARSGSYAVARSGSEALARRSYQGLEPRLGEHPPAKVVEGRAGIASGFDGEGEARAAPSGLLKATAQNAATAVDSSQLNGDEVMAGAARPELALAVRALSDSLVAIRMTYCT